MNKFLIESSPVLLTVMLMFGVTKMASGSLLWYY